MPVSDCSLVWKVKEKLDMCTFLGIGLWNKMEWNYGHDFISRMRANPNHICLCTQTHWSICMCTPAHQAICLCTPEVSPKMPCSTDQVLESMYCFCKGVIPWQWGTAMYPSISELANFCEIVTYHEANIT